MVCVLSLPALIPGEHHHGKKLYQACHKKFFQQVIIILIHPQFYHLKKFLLAVCRLVRYYQDRDDFPEPGAPAVLQLSQFVFV